MTPSLYTLYSPYHFEIGDLFSLLSDKCDFLITNVFNCDKAVEDFFFVKKVTTPLEER